MLPAGAERKRYVTESAGPNRTDVRHLGEVADPADLPQQIAISAITMAELAAGPHATRDPEERARRQDRLQRAEATFEPLPFDAAAARAWLAGNLEPLPRSRPDGEDMKTKGRQGWRPFLF